MAPGSSLGCVEARTRPTRTTCLSDRRSGAWRTTPAPKAWPVAGVILELPVRGRLGGASEPRSRAIHHVQRELEAAGDVRNAAAVLCRPRDRGRARIRPRTTRGPLAVAGHDARGRARRYDTVIHLRTPVDDRGYKRGNRCKPNQLPPPRRSTPGSWKPGPTTPDGYRRPVGGASLTRPHAPGRHPGRISRLLCTARQPSQVAHFGTGGGFARSELRSGPCGGAAFRPSGGRCARSGFRRGRARLTSRCH